MTKSILVNGEEHKIDLPPDIPLLWVLRDALNLTGTKFGCGVASCGACTVQIDGEAIRSCQVALGEVWGEVTTIEGHDNPNALSSLQKSWIEHQVAQCGYCQSGQIMQPAALLIEIPNPTDAEIDDAMVGNLCRCGIDARIHEAIHSAAKTMK